MQREREQRRRAAGAAAADQQTVGVGVAPLGEELRGGDGVVHVDTTPVLPQQLPIPAAVPRAASIVDVHDGEPAAGPEAVAVSGGVLANRRGGRAAVDEDDQRWPFARQEFAVGVRRCVVQPMGARAIGGRERDELRRLQERGIEPQVACRPEHVQVAVGEADDLGFVPERGADEQQRVALLSEGADRGVREVGVRRQPVAVGNADDVLVTGVPGPAEDPVGFDDVVLRTRSMRELAARDVDVDVVEVPPVGSIGHDAEPAVGTPLRLHECLVAVAGEPALIRRSTTDEIRDPQFGRVPRHVGMHPLDPDDALAVGRDPWRRVEVGARGDREQLHRPVRGDGDDAVLGLSAIGAVAFVDAHEPVAVGGDAAVGVSQRAGLVGFGRQQHGLAPGNDAAEALIVELDVVGDAVGDPPRSPAVLVDGGAHVGAGRRDLDGVTVSPPHERGSPLLLRALFGPPDVVTVGDDLGDADGTADQ